MNKKKLTPYEATHPGEMIKDELKERGLTQKMLSEQTGIKPSVLSETINGKRPVSLNVAVALGKLAELKTGSQHLTEKYGERGTPSREEFEAKAKAWYFAELLRDERKRQKLTQQQLGERIGKKREYISSLEQSQTDMQLSTFMLISNALGMRFSLVVG